MTSCGIHAGADAAKLPPPASQKPIASEPGGGKAREGVEGAQGQQSFRDFYVKTFSSTFASELFDLRQVSSTARATITEVLLRHRVLEHVKDGTG